MRDIGGIKDAVAFAQTLDMLKDDTPAKIEVDGKTYDINHIRSHKVDGVWCFVISADTVEVDAFGLPNFTG
jgi:hypothetical protein